MGILYLACPYTHPDPAVRRERADKVNRFAAGLIRDGHVVFSPISHSHAITETGLPADWAFWKVQSLALLEVCERVLVLCLDGWDASAGVLAEIEAAERMGKTVGFHIPEIDLSDERCPKL
jgi:hypothetical protein